MLRLWLSALVLGTAWAKPQVVQKFQELEPEKLSKTVELLQNPFLASVFVNSNKKTGQVPSTTFKYEENADLFNYLLSTTQKPKPNLEELLGNPYFLAFYEEFTKQYQKIQQETTTTTTTTTSKPSFFNNPFLYTTESALTSPPVHGTTHRKRPVISPTNPFLSQVKSTESPQVTFTSAPKHISIKVPKGTHSTKVPDSEKPKVFNRIKPTETKEMKAGTVKKELVPEEFSEEEFRKQAESAKYMFASEQEDSINGNFHQREEVRDGVNVKGKYSFSDGFFHRTVHYEADDKGYRVVKEEVEPIGNGPVIDPEGQAKVSQYVAGQSVHYAITKDDIQEAKPKFSFIGLEESE